MAEKRRKNIKNILRNATKPVKGNQLAEKLGVTRQVIVQDVALLRAKGNNIIATPQGYFLADKLGTTTFKRIFPCQHDFSGMKKELEVMVEEGGKVLDVIVEHPLYGELRGNLMLETLEDVKEFVANFNNSEAEPLSVLTKGIHLHTVEALSYEILDNIEKKLQKINLLV